MTELSTRQSIKTHSEGGTLLLKALFQQLARLQNDFVVGTTNNIEFRTKRKFAQENFYIEIELFAPKIGSLFHGYSPDDFPNHSWRDLDEFEADIVSILTLKGLHPKA